MDNEPVFVRTPMLTKPYLVLLPEHISDWDLVCRARSMFPWVQLVVQERLPTETDLGW